MHGQNSFPQAIKQKVTHTYDQVLRGLIPTCQQHQRGHRTWSKATLPAKCRCLPYVMRPVPKKYTQWQHVGKHAGKHGSTFDIAINCYYGICLHIEQGMFPCFARVWNNYAEIFTEEMMTMLSLSAAATATFSCFEGLQQTDHHKMIACKHWRGAITDQSRK
jgi:hypothetical protein